MFAQISTPLVRIYKIFLQAFFVVLEESLGVEDTQRVFGANGVYDGDTGWPGKFTESLTQSVEDMIQA